MIRDAKAWAVLALIVVVPFVLSGCIVWNDCWWCDSSNRPPRMVSFRAYVYDYYTGATIPWGFVEVYEEDWWSWDYIGTWGVGPYGYVTANLGYVYYHGNGGPDDREYRIEAYAEGYYSEWVDIRLDYYDTHDTIYFYLAPWYGKDALDEPGVTTEREGPPDDTVGGHGKVLRDEETASEPTGD